MWQIATCVVGELRCYRLETALNAIQRFEIDSSGTRRGQILPDMIGGAVTTRALAWAPDRGVSGSAPPNSRRFAPRASAVTTVSRSLLGRSIRYAWRVPWTARHRAGSIACVLVMAPDVLAVVNDNNDPFDTGRHVGVRTPADNEFILVKLAAPLN
jgi:hypothetical protein